MSEPVEWGDDEPVELGPPPYLPTVIDAELCPDDVAAWACTVTPGSAVLTALAAIDPHRLGHAGLLCTSQGLRGSPCTGGFRGRAGVEHVVLGAWR